MARMARVVVAGAPHHVTQRGNRRQTTFFAAEDYLAYLQIAADEFRAAEVEIWAYCLMPNHVHLIATPGRAEGLAAAVGATHLRYTRQVNRRERWTGYLWQGRFASFPMDGDLSARLRAICRPQPGSGRPSGAGAGLALVERASARRITVRSVADGGADRRAARS